MAKETRKRQMKFLGGVWELRGVKEGNIGVKQLFSVEELEWMLEKAKCSEKGRIALFTEPRYKRSAGGHACTHTTIAYVFEGEWGWDEKMPVKDVEVDVETSLDINRGSPKKHNEDPFG